MDESFSHLFLYQFILQRYTKNIVTQKKLREIRILRKFFLPSANTAVMPGKKQNWGLEALFLIHFSRIPLIINTLYHFSRVVYI